MCTYVLYISINSMLGTCVFVFTPFGQNFQVVTLINVDLLRHQQQWKDGLQDLRTGFATLEAQV